MSVMVNTTKITAQELRDKLEEAEVEARLHPWLNDCLLLARTGNLEELDAFQKGLFHISPSAPVIQQVQELYRQGRPLRRLRHGSLLLAL